MPDSDWTFGEIHGRLGVGATPTSAHAGQRGNAATESASEKHLKKSIKRTSDSVNDASVDEGTAKGWDILETIVRWRLILNFPGKDKKGKEGSDRTNAEDSRTTSAPSGSAKRKNVSSLNDFLDRGTKQAKKGAKSGNS